MNVAIPGITGVCFLHQLSLAGVIRATAVGSLATVGAKGSSLIFRVKPNRRLPELLVLEGDDPANKMRVTGASRKGLG
jgi:hypothetical protein